MTAAGIGNTTNSEVRAAAAQNSMLQDGVAAEEEVEAAEEKAAAEDAAQAKAAEIKAKAKGKPKGKSKAAGASDPDTPPNKGGKKDPQVVLLAQAKDVKQQRSNVMGSFAEIKNLTATHPEWKFASTPAEVETLQTVMDKLQVSNLV